MRATEKEWTVTTDHTPRLYALAGSILGLFLAWAGIAAHPWQTTSSATPRSAALETYTRRLNADAALVAALTGRRSAAPSVRVVTLPPLTTTRTS
jgi:hypothetical protein